MPEDAEYKRGREAGEIAARLAQHDQHFANINGSIGKLAGKMEDMTTAIQALADSQASRDLIAASVAAALVKEQESRKMRQEQRWTWPVRMAAVFTVLAAAATVTGVLFSVFRK